MMAKKKKKVVRKKRPAAAVAKYVDVPDCVGSGYLETENIYGELPAFGDVFRQEYTRNDIRTIVKDNAFVHPHVFVHHQGGSSTCTANAACSGWEDETLQILGVKIRLSPISLYRFTGRSPGSGSSVSGNVRRIKSVGALPMDTPENRAALKRMGLPEEHCLTAHHDWYYKKSSIGWPHGDAWKSTAAHFRMDETYEVRGVVEIWNALVQGFQVHIGRRGHSINYVWPWVEGNKMGAWYKDSYGTGRGKNGFLVDTEGRMATWGVAYRKPLLTDKLLKLAL